MPLTLMLPMVGADQWEIVRCNLSMTITACLLAVLSGSPVCVRAQRCSCDALGALAAFLHMLWYCLVWPPFVRFCLALVCVCCLMV